MPHLLLPPERAPQASGRPGPPPTPRGRAKSPVKAAASSQKWSTTTTVSSVSMGRPRRRPEPAGSLSTWSWPGCPCCCFVSAGLGGSVPRLPAVCSRARRSTPDGEVWERRWRPRGGGKTCSDDSEAQCRAEQSGRGRRKRRPQAGLKRARAGE